MYFDDYCLYFEAKLLMVNLTGSIRKHLTDISCNFGQHPCRQIFLIMPSLQVFPSTKMQ